MKKLDAFIVYCLCFNLAELNWPEEQSTSIRYLCFQPVLFLFFQLKEVNQHPWATAGGKGELELETPMMEVVQTHIIPGNKLHRYRFIVDYQHICYLLKWLA